MLSAADVPLLAAFAAVVRHASFSRAGTELQLSKSVVSERVKLLEERCGVRLLERTTRRMRLTEAGAEVFATATDLEESLTRLSGVLDAGRAAPSGTLRVATTVDLGALLVGPVGARLVVAHPAVRLEIVSQDQAQDVLAAGVDVAVRLGTPQASSLVMQRLAVLEEPIVAAPAVAARLGPVSRPADLREAAWVRHSLVAGKAMEFLGPAGATEEVALRVCAEANSGPAVLGLLLGGAGVGVLPEHLVREPLASGRLVRLCAPWIWKRISLFALLPSRPQRPVVKAFLALLQAQVAADRLRWGDAAVLP